MSVLQDKIFVQLLSRFDLLCYSSLLLICTNDLAEIGCQFYTLSLLFSDSRVSDFEVKVLEQSSAPTHSKLHQSFLCFLLCFWPFCLHHVLLHFSSTYKFLLPSSHCSLVAVSEIIVKCNLLIRVPGHDFPLFCAQHLSWSLREVRFVSMNTRLSVSNFKKLKHSHQDFRGLVEA